MYFELYACSCDEVEVATDRRIQQEREMTALWLVSESVHRREFYSLTLQLLRRWQRFPLPTEDPAQQVASALRVDLFWLDRRSLALQLRHLFWGLRGGHEGIRRAR